MRRDVKLTLVPFLKSIQDPNHMTSIFNIGYYGPRSVEQGLTLNILMNSSLWFDKINLECLLYLWRGGSQVIVSK